MRASIHSSQPHLKQKISEDNHPPASQSGSGFCNQPPISQSATAFVVIRPAANRYPRAFVGRSARQKRDGWDFEAHMSFVSLIRALSNLIYQAISMVCCSRTMTNFTTFLAYLNFSDASSVSCLLEDFVLCLSVM